MKTLAILISFMIFLCTVFLFMGQVAIPVGLTHYKAAPVLRWSATDWTAEEVEATFVNKLMILLISCIGIGIIQWLYTFNTRKEGADRGIRINGPGLRGDPYLNYANDTCIYKNMC